MSPAGRSGQEGAMDGTCLRTFQTSFRVTLYTGIQRRRQPPWFSRHIPIGGIDTSGNIVGISYYVDSSGNTTANEATLWSPTDGFLTRDLGPASVVGGNGFMT